VIGVFRRLRYGLLDRALERGALPAPLLRAGARAGARARLRRELRGGVEEQERRVSDLVESMRHGAIAEMTTRVNEQRYGLPAEFFELFLGPRLKYSCGFWDEGVGDLALAEEAMLALSCERAGIEDGMSVLDLGCGWGAMSLWLCERYPRARVVAVSNSATQRAWIEAVRDRRGFRDRLTVIAADVNTLTLEERFDRVLSIEMFEQMRNWEALLARIAGWLERDGRLFVQVFSHRQLAYAIGGTWAADRFLAAGRMPSHDLLLRFQRDLEVVESWALSGAHYARTLSAWGERLDAHADRAGVILGQTLGARAGVRAVARWRLFLLATQQMWALHDGQEWIASQYLLAPR
jgi:cyclopropane-fatty-acyl-phospholipid synthase